MFTLVRKSVLVIVTVLAAFYAIPASFDSSILLGLAVTWLIVGFPLGILLGRSIRLADLQQAKQSRPDTMPARKVHNPHVMVL